MTNADRNVGIVTSDRSIVHGITASMVSDFAGATPYARAGQLAGAQAPAAAPAAPSLTAPRGSITLVSAKPTFRWTRVSGAATYDLPVFKQGRLLVGQGGITALSWQRHRPLPRNVDLVARVRAVGAGGAGAWSKDVHFRVGIDYANRAHWLTLPGRPLKKVDVFYVYPSSYSKPDASAPNIGGIDDPGMAQKARQQYSREATAFTPFANIYAPYYRQADALYALSLPPAQRSRLIGDVPASDVIAAFSYYIEHYNHHRPFILAGHSQDSQVIELLLARYMKQHPAVYKHMIVAYVVGYSVTPSYLARYPFLRFAKAADDTGAIVSWNTEAPTIAAPNPVVLPGGISINPITWTRKQTEAGAARNLGSIELNEAGTPVRDKNGNIKRVRDLADARVDKARASSSAARSTPRSRPTTNREGSLRACSTSGTTRSTSSMCARTPATGSRTTSWNTRSRRRRDVRPGRLTRHRTPRALDSQAGFPPAPVPRRRRTTPDR